MKDGSSKTGVDYFLCVIDSGKQHNGSLRQIRGGMDSTSGDDIVKVSYWRDFQFILFIKVSVLTFED